MRSTRSQSSRFCVILSLQTLHFSASSLASVSWCESHRVAPSLNKNGSESWTLLPTHQTNACSAHAPQLPLHEVSKVSTLNKGQTNTRAWRPATYQPALFLHRRLQLSAQHPWVHPSVLVLPTSQQCIPHLGDLHPHLNELGFVHLKVV